MNSTQWLECKWHWIMGVLVLLTLEWSAVALSFEQCGGVAVRLHTMTTGDVVGSSCMHSTCGESISA